MQDYIAIAYPAVVAILAFAAGWLFVRSRLRRRIAQLDANSAEALRAMQGVDALAQRIGDMEKTVRAAADQFEHAQSLFAQNLRALTDQLTASERENAALKVRLGQGAAAPPPVEGPVS